MTNSSPRGAEGRLIARCRYPGAVDTRPGGSPRPQVLPRGSKPPEVSFALMQLQCEDSSDPIGAALKCAAHATGEHTEDHPLTPELFWVHLAGDGFGFRGSPPGSDEHGRFFAHLVLDHAVATEVITGNTAMHHYWPRTGPVETGRRTPAASERP